MIAFVKGEIAAMSEDAVVIDAGHIGYDVRISTGTANLLPGMGQEVRLHTYTHVREDAFQLYGFLTRDDREIFKQLISVSGIGPKGGLAVLSVMSADDLRFAIMAADATAISRAPGIGKKTAERIILELREKVAPEAAFMPGETKARGIMGAGAYESSAKNEAVEALVALGYGASEALRAVKKVEPGADMDTETILKAALKHCYS